jgi:hypothetical protein
MKPILPAFSFWWWWTRCWENFVDTKVSKISSWALAHHSLTFRSVVHLDLIRRCEGRVELIFPFWVSLAFQSIDFGWICLLLDFLSATHPPGYLPTLCYPTLSMKSHNVNAPNMFFFQNCFGYPRSFAFPYKF